MEKVGEKNNEELKGTTATRPSLLSNWNSLIRCQNFSCQTLVFALCSLFSHQVLGTPVEVSGITVLSSFVLQGGEMERILIVKTRGRTSLVNVTQYPPKRSLLNYVLFGRFHKICSQILRGCQLSPSCCTYYYWQPGRGYYVLMVPSPYHSSSSAGDQGAS